MSLAIGIGVGISFTTYGEATPTGGTPTTGILLENGDFLLAENGDFLVQE